VVRLRIERPLCPGSITITGRSAVEVGLVVEGLGLAEAGVGVRSSVVEGVSLPVVAVALAVFVGVMGSDVPVSSGVGVAARVGEPLQPLLARSVAASTAAPSHRLTRAHDLTALP